MPGMDGTGPTGMGAGTGWGRGRCFGYGFYGSPGYYSSWGPGWGRSRDWGQGRGMGRGLGRGYGRGFRGRFWAGGPPAWDYYGPGPWGAPSREDEVAWLKDQAQMLKADMETVQRRIDELAAEEES
jgi:hypothetical protein